MLHAELASRVWELQVLRAAAEASHITMRGTKDRLGVRGYRLQICVVHPVDGDDVLHAELASRVQEIWILRAAAAGLAHNIAEGGQCLDQSLTLRQLIVGLHRLHNSGAVGLHQ